jgi:Fe-S cluster biogenesis protein NfuA
VRPYLGTHAGDVELLGIDENGVAHLRLTGTCDGCPSSRVTVQQAIEQEVRGAAPEITAIDVQGMVSEQALDPGGRPLLPLEAVECPVPGGGR